MISGKTILNTLGQQIDAVLKPLIPYGTNCALLEFPNYTNAGDSAIWLGAKAWLLRNRNTVVYQCDKDTYSRALMAGQLNDGIVLLQGGGNFGDVWTDLQYFRERVIQDFPDNKIIQLPQTLFFKQEINIARTRNILKSHPNLTLLVRDQQSLDFAHRAFDVPTFLCPDMAFALGSVERPCLPETDIVWLSRTDKETLNRPAPKDIPGIIRTDWLEEPSSNIKERNEYLSQELKAHPDKAEALYSELADTYDLIAQERFLRGCTMLSTGKVVVTDRLHGHILCLLMGIPHVLLDNNYGKVSGFHQAWTSNNELTQWADSPEEVVNTAFANQQFRSVLQSKGIDLTSLDRIISSLKTSMREQTGWVTAEEEADKLWHAQVDLLQQDILPHTSGQQPFILVDEDQLRSMLELDSDNIIPFPEQNRLYAGPPQDDETAILALTHMRNKNARFIAFAWPAFWWLDHYTGFAQHLRTNFKCLLKNERIVLFDLQS